MTAVVLWTVVFAAAAWGGALAGEALCSEVEAFADGPRPVAFAVWLFPLAGALIGSALVLHAQSPPRLAVLAFAVFGLAGCTAADLRCGMLPDLLTLAPLALAVGAGVIARDPGPAIGAALVALPFAALAIASRGRGMGWGDVKLAALGGALLGAPDAVFAFMLAAIVAYLIARRRGRTREPIAFGPYLAGSIVATLAAVSGS
jgi:prepilin signal peptidase PulO-like enzyme (type II secretory pathway)